jgi:hypothetical protein
MIAFDLECSAGHLFEAWFNNMQSFEEQNAKKMIRCPYCNDIDIRKVLSPVAVKTSSRPETERHTEPIDYPRLAKEIVEYVERNFDDVGTDFAKEALKMRYDVTEKRNIRGFATAREEEVLREEGIGFFKIPMPNSDDREKN